MEQKQKKDKKTHLIQPLTSHLPQLSHPQIFNRHIAHLLFPHHQQVSLFPSTLLTPKLLSSKLVTHTHNGTNNNTLPPSGPRIKNPNPTHRQTPQTAQPTATLRVQVDGNNAI
jgi:hypothetical protein